MKVGDRVIVNGMHDGVKFVNEPGRIIGFTTANGDVCIEFDNYIGIPFHSYNSILFKIETKTGHCWFASPEMITKEITMEERIEELEQELAELKTRFKHESKPCRYIVQGDGTIFDVKGWEDEQEDANTYKKTGRAFDTKEKAMKARGIMVKHDIILKYVIDHAPDYEPEINNTYSVYFDNEKNIWAPVMIDDSLDVGTIAMPSPVAKKLAYDLNNDRIDFN